MLYLRTLPRRVVDQHRYTNDSYSGVVAQWHAPNDAEPNDVIAGTEENPKRLRPTYASQADALADAASKWQRIQRGLAEFELTLAHGRADALPESPLQVSGFKPEIDPTPWIVIEVTQELGDGGFMSSMQLEVCKQEGGVIRNLEGGQWVKGADLT